MRLVRFNEGQIGIVVGDDVIDVNDLVSHDLAAWPLVAMNRLIANFSSYLPLLEKAMDRPRIPLSQS